MRVLTRTLSRRGDADHRQHLDRAVPRCTSRCAGVHARDLGDLVSDGEDRIERGHRLLEDHRDAIAANATDAGIVELQEILILEHDATSGLDTTRLLDETENRERRDRLATPRFADDAERLACADREGHAIHSARHAGAGVEVRAEIGDGEKGRLRHRAGSWRAFSASRKPSATRFTASTVMTSAAPADMEIHHVAPTSRIPS